MRGQCYDGAFNMSGARSGVKAVVEEVAPKAMCSINLSVISVASKHSRIPRLT